MTHGTRTRRHGPARAAGSPVRRGGPLLAGFGLLTLGVVAVVWYASPMRHWLDVAAFGLLLALVAGTVGLLLGCAFGIPRAAPPKRENRDVSPLHQVSDWLVKIIIGIGLAELGRALLVVTRLGPLLAIGLGGRESSGAAAGLELAYFGPIGFLFGYLFARAYLPTPYRDPAPERMIPAGSVATPLRRAIAGLPRVRSRAATRAVPPPRAESTASGEPVDLATLVSRLNGLLAELVRPLSAHGRRTGELTDILVRRGVLSADLAGALTDFADAAAEVAAGATMSPLDAAAVRKSGGALLAELAGLRAVAGRAFEMRVLEALDTGRRPGWRLFTDHAVGAAMVDALVVDQAGGEVVVEVRARARCADESELTALGAWLAGLPEDVPVLLVLPGDRDARPLPTGRRGPVRVVHWDHESAAFVPTLVGLLGTA